MPNLYMIENEMRYRHSELERELGYHQTQNGYEMKSRASKGKRRGLVATLLRIPLAVLEKTRKKHMARSSLPPDSRSKNTRTRC